jgi:hypothetical protein
VCGYYTCIYFFPICVYIVFLICFCSSFYHSRPIVQVIEAKKKESLSLSSFVYVISVFLVQRDSGRGLEVETRGG